MGAPPLSMTLVPIGAFSSTKPSTADAVITGGLLSTGLTVIVSFAVVERLASDTSTAYREKRNLIIMCIMVNEVCAVCKNHLIEKPREINVKVGFIFDQNIGLELFSGNNPEFFIFLAICCVFGYMNSIFFENQKI